MKNRVTELLGIEKPILQGGMAWIAESTLASAVSNAGGAGIIAGGSAPIDYLRAEIRKCKELTDKPFGVNIMLMSPMRRSLQSSLSKRAFHSSPQVRATPVSTSLRGKRQGSR